MQLSCKYKIYNYDYNLEQQVNVIIENFNTLQ